MVKKQKVHTREVVVACAVHRGTTQLLTSCLTGNDYQPKCDNALHLGSKGRYDAWQVKLCVILLICAIPERLCVKHYIQMSCL